MVYKYSFGLLWLVFQNVRSEWLLDKTFQTNNNLLTRNLSCVSLGNPQSVLKCGTVSTIRNYRIFIHNGLRKPTCKGCIESPDGGGNALANLHYTAWEIGKFSNVSGDLPPKRKCSKSVCKKTEPLSLN